MGELWPAVSGTGHRPATRKHPDGITAAALPWVREKARAGLLWLQRKRGTTDVHSGLALGFDTILAQAALDVGMALHAHIPFEAQAERWPTSDRREWQRLRDAAATVTVYGPDPLELVLTHPDITDAYVAAVRLLHARNDGLLDAAQGGVVFACWNAQKRTGGTASAVRKAAQRGLPVLHIDPVTRTVHLPGCPCTRNL